MYPALLRKVRAPLPLAFQRPKDLQMYPALSFLLFFFRAEFPFPATSTFRAGDAASLTGLERDDRKPCFSIQLQV